MKLTSTQLRSLIKEVSDSKNTDSAALLPLLKELQNVIDRMDDLRPASSDVNEMMDKLYSAYINLKSTVLREQKSNAPAAQKGHFIGSRFKPED